jgi:hypothetical protein
LYCSVIFFFWAGFYFLGLYFYHKKWMSHPHSATVMWWYMHVILATNWKLVPLSWSGPTDCQWPHTTSSCPVGGGCWSLPLRMSLDGHVCCLALSHRPYFFSLN